MVGWLTCRGDSEGVLFVGSFGKVGLQFSLGLLEVRVTFGKRRGVLNLRREGVVELGFDLEGSTWRVRVPGRAFSVRGGGG